MNATYKLVNWSQNGKTGPMPAVYGTRASCPIDCKLYDACYGKQGKTALHWAKENDKSFDDLIGWIKGLNSKIWRFGVVGDFPSVDSVTLDAEKISTMALANKKRAVLAYTHFPLNASNIDILKHANASGLTINKSCDSMDEVNLARKNGIPAVTYTSHDDTRKSWQENGIRFVTRPNQYHPKKPTCAECKLCARGSRTSIVVFRAHGSASKKVLGVI